MHNTWQALCAACLLATWLLLCTSNSSSRASSSLVTTGAQSPPGPPARGSHAAEPRSGAASRSRSKQRPCTSAPNLPAQACLLGLRGVSGQACLVDFQVRQANCCAGPHSHCRKQLQRRTLRLKGAQQHHSRTDMGRRSGHADTQSQPGSCVMRLCTSWTVRAARPRCSKLPGSPSKV